MGANFDIAKDARVLITGAAGFIGSHLALALHAMGASVTAIDNFDDLLGQGWLKTERARLLEQAGVPIKNMNLVTSDLSTLGQASVVFHLAALPGLSSSWRYPSEYYSSNVVAAVRLGDWIRNQNHATHIVHASTSSVYGEFATGNEDSPLQPTSPYGTSKLAAEIAISNLLGSESNSLAILRYFSVYGPGQRPDMAYSKFISALRAGRTIQISGTGDQTRTNTYVTDVVGLTIEVGLSRIAGTFNVGGPVSLSVNEALSILSSLAGVKASIRYVPRPPGDQEKTSADVGRIESRLGKRSFVSPSEGLAMQYRSMKSDCTENQLLGEELDAYLDSWRRRAACFVG